MKRRTFLSGSIMATAGLSVSMGTAPSAAGANRTSQAGETTPPVLQVPSATSIGVVWGVSEKASGWVEYSTDKSFSDKKIVHAGGLALHALSDKLLSVNLTGLKPNTRYYYRTATQAYSVPGAYSTKRLGNPVFSGIYTFKTIGTGAEASFAVINDTHENRRTFQALSEKIDRLDPSVLVWNGDAFNQLYSEEHAISVILNPIGRAYAANRPLLFLPGNHDYRGVSSRFMDQVLIPRLPEERESRFAGLKYNFALRLGEIALIGLDTGEDKPDRHPTWAGLANFEPYRELQTEWLKGALERPEIKSAPFLIPFCHIPLFSSTPNANPGDILQGYADWQRPCSRMWSPLLNRYGAQALITAHIHAFKSDPPSGARRWHQIQGGGPEMASATLIYGKVGSDGKLKIDVFALSDDRILGSYTFAPRKRD